MTVISNWRNVKEEEVWSYSAFLSFSETSVEYLLEARNWQK